MEDWGVSDRQVDYWQRMGVPRSVAKQQAEWARRMAIVRLHQQGMTLREIGLAMGRSGCRMGQILQKHGRVSHHTPPVMAYLTRYGELYDLLQSKHTMQVIHRLGHPGENGLEYEPCRWPKGRRAKRSQRT